MNMGLVCSVLVSLPLEDLKGFVWAIGCNHESMIVIASFQRATGEIVLTM